MRAYSVELRKRVLAAVDAGISHTQAAATFRISERTISRWLSRRVDGPPLAGGTGPGRPPSIAARDLPALRAQLEAHPDATVAEHVALWKTQHPPVSQSALVRAIQRTNWTRKKDVLCPRTRPPSPPSVSGARTDGRRRRPHRH
jgi:transposase